MVWGGVAALALLLVIVYCLWRILTRRPRTPGTGGVTTDRRGYADRDADGSAHSTPAPVGAEVEAARGRARAAAVQRAGARADAAETGHAVSAGQTEDHGRRGGSEVVTHADVERVGTASAPSVGVSAVSAEQNPFGPVQIAASAAGTDVVGDHGSQTMEKESR